MDSPVRKALKRNDYLRHKLFRKIKRRQRNKIQLDLKIAEKELKRRLRRPKFDGGTDDNKVKVTERTYPDGTVVYFADDGKTLTPINTMDSDDMSNWTWLDADNPRITYTGIGSTKDPGEIKQGEGPKSGFGKLHKKLYQVSNKHLQDPIFGAYARFADSWDNDTNPLKAIWELPATKAAVMELAWAKGLQAANRFKNAAVNYERLGKMAPKELEEFFMSRPDLVRESNRAKLFGAAYNKFADDVVKPKYVSAIAATGREYTPEMDAAISNTPKVYEADFGPYSKWGGYYSTGGGRIMMNSRAAGTDSQLFGRHAHEVHHGYRDQLGLLLKFHPNLDIQTNGESIAQIARSGYTPGEMNALEAYQFTPLKLKLSPDLKHLWEKGATNAEIASRIYYDTGLTGKELNDAIMKMPKSKLIEYLKTNAYGQSFLKSPWTKDKEKAIREALTTVASVMPFGVAYNLKYDGGKKAGIDVTYRDVADAYDYLNAHPDASVVLDEQSVVGRAPNASQRLAKYIQESAARDIDKVMLGYLAAGIAPIAMQAAAPGVIAASDAIGGSTAGQVANKALTSPYVSKGLEAAFAGHGLNHVINEGIGGYGDAAMTALELAPLGGLAKPVWNTSQRYIRNIYDKLPWTYNIPEDATMAYRRMGPLERDWLMKGNELSTRKTNPATEAEEAAARAAAKRRFNLFKAGAEHGGRKQFAKGQPWKGTTVTHGEEQVLAIPGKNLPWVSGRHYEGPQGRSFQVGEVPFEEAPFGSHIDLLTEEGFTGVNPSLLDGSVIYSPYKIFGHKFGYKKMYPKKINTPKITAENTTISTPEQLAAAQNGELVVSALPDYRGGAKTDFDLFKRYTDWNNLKETMQNAETTSNNIDITSNILIDPDKRFMMFEPGRFINHDIGAMSVDEVVNTFGPEAAYYKKLYDVAKAHNFEGKYTKIGQDAEYNILNRFAINKTDPDVAKGIAEARGIYDIPEYRARFNKWGTLGDTFVDDALARIDNVKLQGLSKEMPIKGQHGVHGGAYTSPDATTIGITNSESSSWITDMVRHEANHVGHGLKRQPDWMKYHNEKIRPVVREGKTTNTSLDKYYDEMDEIVERSKTAVEYANKIKKEGETLDQALTRLADMTEANIYNAEIPADIRLSIARYTKDSMLNFWKNFVGGYAAPFGIGAAAYGAELYNSGKDIHIKLSKRGTFTAAAKKHGMSVQAYARKVLKAPKGKYSSAMRKKANFARNAAKFKH